MRQRLNLAGASVLPYQFPQLEATPTPLPTTAKPNGVGNGIPPVVSEMPPMAVEEKSDEPDASAAFAEASTRGYADGLQRGFAEGRENGYAAGVEEGAKAEGERLAEATRRLEAIVAQLAEPIAALDRRVEEAVASLALEVARCVIGGEVSRSRDYLARLIREAIAKVPVEMGTPRVVLNPADLDLVRALAPDIEGSTASLIGDESIEPGGCLVVADGDEAPIRDRRWKPRAGEGVSQVNLTLSSRWREVMLALFEGEHE
jgi:flagellar assembly protein FliH